MGKTSIEWTDASWNPVVGCTEVSPGCANCYAARLAATRLKNLPDYKGLTTIARVSNEKNAATRWTGEVRMLPDRLAEPLHWKKPRRIFVCDMGDLFHESVPDEFLYRLFAVMLATPRHTFQVLTKRPARMGDFMRKLAAAWTFPRVPVTVSLPLPNVWLGVSVENQHFADERIPLLLSTPAAVRFLSCEPLLGPVDLRYLQPDREVEIDALKGTHGVHRPHSGENPRINWVICGGESGANARAMHPDWARSLRDQCVAAGVPFFFKQWGEWAGCGIKFGKKKAGRLLDGREWNEFPQVAP